MQLLFINETIGNDNDVFSPAVDLRYNKKL